MKVLFKIYPHQSHLNPTFAFARALREAGHDILYAGLPGMQPQVEAQQLAFYLEPEDVVGDPSLQASKIPITVWQMLRQRRQIALARAAALERMTAPHVFSALLKATKPDLVLIDSSYGLSLLPLLRAGVPVGVVDTMMNADHSVGGVPLDTDYVPTGGMAARTRCELQWRRYFVERWLWAKLGIRPEFARKRVSRLLSKLGLAASTISFERYLQPGLPGIPRLVFPSKCLELPQRDDGRVFYVGTAVDLSRKEASTDYRFSSVFAKFTAARRSGVPLVYASLGTASWRYPGAERFLGRVIDAARGRPWNLVVSVGSDFPLGQFSGAPGNVAVFQAVPQITVLRSADVMITHGGMNSVSESAALGVPMVVYPGTRDIDQAGNAARVVFHGIGLKGVLRSESAGRITRKVETILTDEGFRQRAAAMARRMAAEPMTAQRAGRVLAAAFPALSEAPSDDGRLLSV